jgi:hypothetical protein
LLCHKLLRVATESRMFNLELLLLFVERIYGSVENLQVFPILVNQVSGTFQEFFRGWIAECHVGGSIRLWSRKYRLTRLSASYAII